VTPPNILSLARLISVPLIVWLMLEHRYAAAFWLFIAAGISDGVDGFLAKRFNWRTRLGSFLDPLADKALLVSIYVTLGMQGSLPSWLVILVVSRDILIVGAVLLSLFLGYGVHVEPLRISKANTVAQIGLAGLMLGSMDYGLALEWIVRLGGIVVALTTIASGTSYVAAWVREMAAWESPGPRDDGDEGRR
jgi:cardiolipin synthase